MTDQEILAVFSRTLGNLLGDDSIVLEMQTKRSDVQNWDSFNYVTFIAAVEMELGVRYKVADVESFGTVGDIVAKTRTLLK